MKRFLFCFPQRSAVLARQRMASILYMDRLDCPEDTVKYLKRDIRKVIEKYLDIKREVRQGVKDVKTIQIERL